LPRRLRPRLTYANVVATICLFVVLGGGAYAASNSFVSKGKIRGCVAKSGSLKVLKNKDKKCGKGTSALIWSQTGPVGPSNAFSKTVASPACLSVLNGCSQTVTLTGLPKGSYLVMAKAWANSPEQDSYSDSEDCTLTAGTHSDESKATLFRDETTGLATTDVPVSLQAANKFAGKGQVSLTCLGGSVATVRNVWVSAVRVGAVSIGS
jgi:hypothetical protein